MSRSRRPPLQHPLAHPFGRTVDSLTAALTSESGRQYRGTARHFLTFLRAHYPEVGSLDQLRRELSARLQAVRLEEVNRLIGESGARVPPDSPIVFVAPMAQDRSRGTP